MSPPDPYAIAGEEEEPPRPVAVAPVPAPRTANLFGATLEFQHAPIIEPPEEQEEEQDEEETEPAAATPLVRRFLYLALVLALLPLAVRTFAGGDTTIERIVHTIQAHRDVLGRADADQVSRRSLREDILPALPDQKLDGAHLSYHTSMHYLYALLSAAAFFSLGLVIMPARSTRPMQVFLVGLFTGTAGILLLLGVQYLAFMTMGRIYIHGGIIGIILLIIQMIGWSYYAAMSPSTSFLGSFLGFTFGVGMCEEFCKAMPVLWNMKTRVSLDWRGAFQWGLLSGVGFGVSEGITYAADYYNGIAPASAYLVRFISCVALHGIWSAAAAMSIYRRQSLIQDAEHVLVFLFSAVLLICIPMILHGLYDTMLKKDMHVGALVVAIVSVVYLVYEVESIRRLDEQGALPSFA